MDNDIFLKEQEGQGHLGDLNNKSTQELQELLLRQQQLIANQSLMRKLPDKGSKIRSLCACLETVLETRMKVDETADLLQQMALSAEVARTTRGHADLEQEDACSVLDVIRNQAIGEKQIIDERDDVEQQEEFVVSYKRVIKPAEERTSKEPHKEKFFLNRTLKNKDLDSSKTLKSKTTPHNGTNPQNLALDTGQIESDQASGALVQDGGSTTSTESTNHQKMDTEENTETVNNVNPSRQKTACDNPDNGQSIVSPVADMNSSKDSALKPETAKVPAGAVSKSDLPLPPGGRSGRLKYTYDETLEADMSHIPRHEPAKLLSIEESVQLLRKQKKLQEIATAQQAALKLGGNPNIKMKPFDPEGSRFSMYRDTAADELDADSKVDSDDELELDYPD